MTRTGTLVGYAVVALAFATYECWARRCPHRAPLGRVVTALATWPPTRWPLLAAWLWLGWHVFARVHWR